MSKICITVLYFLVYYTAGQNWEANPYHRETQLSRCTRRYTPGACTEPVTVVWTFAFQIQNCTERMGCRHSTRTNRFPSHRECMRTCNVLARLYGHILASGGQNDTISQLISAPARREGIEMDDTEESTADEKTEVPGHLPLVNFDDDEVWKDLEYVLPLDLDNVNLDRVPDQEDFFHDAFGRNYLMNKPRYQ